MYGLNDAPQLWQLSLRYHLQIEMKATPSHHDDCFFSWRDPETGRCTGVATAHVDDTNNSAPQHLLDSRRAILEKRFGALTVAKTPFVHVGITVERMSDGGYRLHQAAFAKAIKLLEVKRGRPAEEPLSPAEVTLLRGALGGLLYLTYTRPDISAEVVLLQTKINVATVAELRQCNATIKRAHSGSSLGLVFPKLVPPLTLLAISDASFSTSSTSYAVEGSVVVLRQAIPEEDHASEKPGSFLSGPCHLLYHHSQKAKRVSHSTSHAESLSQYGVLTAAEQIAERFTELNAPFPPSLAQLIEISSDGKYDLKIHACTDCRDLLELVVGAKGAPQDKSQRLIILSLRERRVIGKTSSISHIVTQDMVANSLTKREDSSQLNQLLTSGTLVLKQFIQHRPGSIKSLAGFRARGYDETDLSKFRF